MLVLQLDTESPSFRVKTDVVASGYLREGRASMRKGRGEHDNSGHVIETENGYPWFVDPRASMENNAGWIDSGDQRSLFCISVNASLALGCSVIDRRIRQDDLDATSPPDLYCMKITRKGGGIAAI